MSLEHAILGFLNYIPLTGYDLKKAFDASVHHFWPADQSQIYRTLARLTEQGWVEVKVIQRENRPPRRVYSLTEAGQEELRCWLTSLLPPEDARIPWLVQVFFAGLLSDDEILAIFERVAKQLRAKLQRAHKIPEESAAYVEAVGSPRETFFWMLTLDYRIKIMEAELAWIEDAIKRLQRKDQPPAEQQQ
ncbi:MAG: PadR family transcriptional regulator [Chloroflexi bacterium]|nr:PadR family transcriptional regulator [Chloroflexota bacterium]